MRLAVRAPTIGIAIMMIIKKLSWLRAMRNAPTRDVAVAMLVKSILLLALFALLSRPVFQPANDSAATAAAVAGPSGVQ
jgi:hypothetical protein